MAARSIARTSPTRPSRTATPASAFKSSATPRSRWRRPASSAPGPGSRRTGAAPTPTTPTRTSRTPPGPTTAPTWRGCAGSRRSSTRRTASAPLRASSDGDGGADLDEPVELLDVGVLHAHAAVRDLARDQARQRGAVDADDAAARPVGELVRRGARDVGDRAVERVAEVRQLRADVELALGRRPL